MPCHAQIAVRNNGIGKVYIEENVLLCGKVNLQYMTNKDKY